jgi:hypothetical protein
MAEHDDTQRVRERMRDLIALKFEGWGEAWTDDESGDRLALVATDAAMAVVDAVLAARDAAVELLNGTRVALGHAEDKASDRLRDLVATRRDAAQAIAAKAKAVRDLEVDLAAARQQLDAVRELAGKAAPPRYDNGGNYEGLASGDPARHRTVGSHRAWSDAGEWCYPHSPCRDCHAPVDRADLLSALARPAGHDETGQ